VAADRNADRHRLKSLGRLDDPGDDAWLRAYAKQTGQSIRKVVIAAVKHYRQTIETEPETTSPESEER
jgi:hypothetical protein